MSQRVGGNQGHAIDVVDDLGVDVRIGTEHVQTGTLGSAGDLATNADMPLQAHCILINLADHFGTPPLLLTTGLTNLAADNFGGVLDALALVRLGGTLTTDFSGKLANDLLVNTADDDLVGSRNFHSDAGP